GRDDRRRIWQVMNEQFGLAVSEALNAQLADIFPQACGRDIKGLAKLVAKYCRYKNVSPTMDVFIRCSGFRGMSSENIAAENINSLLS
ncbi:MAG: AAA family ATPase, partial [Oceanospirillaceae bacterium]|nr:AAA family ATPase [Oceanospirillaceae bacterium]